MLALSHLTSTVCLFFTYEFFFANQLAHYLNGYIESSCELAKVAKKFKLEAEMLKRAREKTEEVGEVSIRADAAERRAENVETALRKTVEENSRLLKKIKELKTHLEAEEKRIAEAAFKAVDFRASKK